MLLVLLSAGLLVLSSAQSTDNDVINEEPFTAKPDAEGPSQSQDQQHQGPPPEGLPPRPPPDDENQDPPPPPPINQQGPTPLGGPDHKRLPSIPGNYQIPPQSPRGCVRRTLPKVHYPSNVKFSDRKLGEI